MKFKHKCNRRNLKNFVVRVGLEPVSNWEKKSTPRANRLSYEFTWLWRCKYSKYTVSLSSVYKSDTLNLITFLILYLF